MVKESDVFKALADQTRLRVLNLLIEANESLCVCELVDALKLPQYHVSRHLQVLKNVDLVDVEKRGTWGYYVARTDIPQNKLLFSFLKGFAVRERFAEDVDNLRLRLLLREEGKCVVGFVPETKLVRMIQTKKRVPRASKASMASQRDLR
jgi:ArsR family transcriptional regulator